MQMRLLVDGRFAILVVLKSFELRSFLFKSMIANDNRHMMKILVLRSLVVSFSSSPSITSRHTSTKVRHHAVDESSGISCRLNHRRHLLADQSPFQVALQPLLDSKVP
jgi:hypothetical protein